MTRLYARNNPLSFFSTRFQVISEALHSSILQHKDDIRITLDQGKHRLTRPSAPVVAGIIGILHLVALGEAVEAADDIIGVLIMQRRTVRHHIEVPAQGSGSASSM